MDDLGSPRDWKLKGEGNANLVFAYTGRDPRLVGRVLRVRKPRAAPAPEQAALEDAVWAPVLGPLPADYHANGAVGHASTGQATQQQAPHGAEALAVTAAAAAAAAQREQQYVERMLAPLLGRHHIPPQQPVHPDPTFLQQLLSGSGACSSSNAQAAAAAAGTAALLPDVTLLPQREAAIGLAPQAQQQAAQHQQAASQQQQQQQRHQPAGQPVGPVVCVELKPKCGFVPSCGTVHPSNRDLKHSRSRYQLHQLLKLSQGKIDACSAYDPCDLFSGDAARLRSALAALLEQPQNNLLLFVDGQRQELAGQQRRKGQHGQHIKQQQGQQREQQQEQEQQQQQQKGQQASQQEAAPPLEQLLGGLLPLPPAQQRSALVELLAAVLEREGVLPRLLQAQQQCPYDVEGIYRLYCQLAGLQREEAGMVAAEDDGSSGSSSSKGNDSSDSGSSAAHAAAVAQLLALPAGEAHAVLRSYVVSATAKDCAVMVALQRLDGPPEAAAGAECVARVAAGVAAAGMAVGSEAANDGEAAAVQHDSPERQQWWDMPPACIFLPGLDGGQQSGGGSSGQQADASGSGSSGGWFSYRLCFVDLDLKPLAKIPAHAELDRRIVAAAKRHLRAAGGTAGVP